MPPPKSSIYKPVPPPKPKPYSGPTPGGRAGSQPPSIQVSNQYFLNYALMHFNMCMDFKSNIASL